MTAPGQWLASMSVMESGEPKMEEKSWRMSRSSDFYVSENGRTHACMHQQA
jgi:hypothetical protein